MSKKLIAEKVMVDTISKKRDETFLLRRSFYYRHGYSGQMFADHVIEKLGNNWRALDYGEVNRPFKGGAPIARQSHWWVIVKEKVTPFSDNEISALSILKSSGHDLEGATASPDESKGVWIVTHKAGKSRVFISSQGLVGDFEDLD